MIFGMFGGKGGSSGDDEDDDEEIELVTFQGPLNGKEVDLSANARLAQAGLIPAKELVSDALQRRAEMAKIELKGERAQVTLYVDGMAYSGGKLPKPQAIAISQMLKLLAGLDPKLKGQAQSGGLKAQFQELPYEILVETTPQPDGSDRVVLRTRNLKVKMSTVEELGFPPSMKPLIRELTAKKRGVILVAGPSGSGTTTTVYALLRSIDLYMYQVYTIVQMGSREVYNVTKFEVNEGDALEQTLLRIIRAEGDVVFIDPIKNADIAKQVATAADQIAVLAEIPGKDAASAAATWTAFVGDAEKAADLFEAAVSQKLIRTLCADCREAFRPNPKLLAKVGLPPETKVLYRKPEPEPDPKTGELPEPCEKCGGTGYIGRTAMMEVVLGSESIRKLLREGGSAEQIKAQARAEGMLTLHKDALRLVAEGKTALEEVQRVFKS